MPTLGKDADKVSQEKVKKIRNQVKAGIRKLQERIFTAGSEEIIKDLNALYPKMSCLAGLASDLARKYNEKKARKSMVDFNDLEHYCLELLTQKDEDGNLIPSQTAVTYRERFVEVMVDEYQDSNLVQEIIIKMISRALRKAKCVHGGRCKAEHISIQTGTPGYLHGKVQHLLNRKGALIERSCFTRTSEAGKK